MSVHISINKEKIADFCKKYHIKKLAFFGSVLRDDFGPESDVDVLVEFEPGISVGLIRMAGMELELSGIIGRKVDLRTAKDLSRYFRDEVVDNAEVQYAA
ncbi:MAG: nucleotidyltransferase family protein [Armatimonadota bacterium]